MQNTMRQFTILIQCLLVWLPTNSAVMLSEQTNKQPNKQTRLRGNLGANSVVLSNSSIGEFSDALQSFQPALVTDRKLRKLEIRHSFQPALRLQAQDAPYVFKAGIKVHYDPLQQHAGFYRASYLGWEPGTFQVFQHFVKDKVVLDIGAWIGSTALWTGHLAKKVVALEPTATAFGELSANLAANPELAGKVVVLNAALDSQDRIAKMTNNGDSQDKILSVVSINVRSVTIGTLVKEHPELQDTGFVKIDTEGYEATIVPAMEQFFKEKKPVAFVSLHPMFISHTMVQGVVDKLKDTFPYLYEVDMKTPFNTKRSQYTYGDHGGADVVCTWVPLA